jgi:hypothetical protein
LPSRLLAFLDPHRGYFSNRGYDLPPAADGEPVLDYEQLAAVFLTPDTSTPDELVHSILLVDEMSSTEAADDLLDIARERGIAIDDGDDHTPADIAIQVWLRDRETLEQRHARQFLYRARSFAYYQADTPVPPALATPTSATRIALEQCLDEWFIDHKRGGNSRVFAFPNEDEVWFLVRHGEPLKREESIQGGTTTTVCYRPLKYDVIIYRRATGELRLNVKPVGQKRLYLEQFASHLFPQGTTFSEKRFTLKPLIEMGEEALAIGDVDGIDDIKLAELHLMWGGGFKEIEIRKADDLFAAFATRDYRLPQTARPERAVFKVTFADSEKARSVVVRSSNAILYTRDTDAAAVEEWLALRGFLDRSTIVEHEPVA